jgi:hypothetical protein
MRKKYTGEKAKNRRDRQAKRQNHIRALNKNEVMEELPSILLPELFMEIQETSDSSNFALTPCSF